LKKHVSKLVDDGELPLQTNLLAASLQQFMDERRGGVEAGRQLLLAGREIEPILPVPLLPTAMMFSRRVTYSERA
jgi:hypothetical protein